MAKMHVKSTTIANTTPGYSIKAFIGLHAEMATIPAATAGVVSTDITFEVDTPAKGFMQVYNAPKRQSASSSTTGEAGMTSENYAHQLFVPGDVATVREFIKTIENQPLIVLVQDGTQGGPVRMYGTEQNPAYVDSKAFESGTLADGTKGYVITIFAKEKYDYTGTVTEMGE